MKSFREMLGMTIVACALVFSATAEAQTGLYVDGSGNVGIGTTTPAATLDVNGPVAVDGGAAATALDVIGPVAVESNSATVGLFMQNNSTNPLEQRIKTNNSEWVIRNHTNGGKLRIKEASRSEVFDFSPNGNLTIDGSLTQGSSRTIKTDILPVDDREMLARVVQLPVFSWRYKADEAGEHRVGPMAEDFRDTFGIGNGTHIEIGTSTGVSLAAIRGLNQILTEKEAEIALLKGDNAKFAERLTALERQMQLRQ